MKSVRNYITLIILLLFVWSVVPQGLGAQRRKRSATSADSLHRDSLAVDSLRVDTVPADTVKKKKDALDAPVTYEASDSAVWLGSAGNAVLYGSGKVNYQQIELTAEVIALNQDSSLVHAHGVKDSTGQWKGRPIFKEKETPYESETMSYNFKTKKGFINNITTQQGEGYITSQDAKKGANDEYYMQHGKYTTCDDEHPHFYLALSRAKVRPKKNVVFGPAWLVVEDVPLPLAIPFGFFPFSSKYSSGFIMPSYGDETTRGFYLRDGGYYFAINDNVDLRLTGEIFTKGSWGLNAASSYNRRYKYSGSFSFSYLDTKTGDKNMPDFSETTSFKVMWTHRQDAKANPNTNFSASVNYATTSYEKSNLSSLYDPQVYSQSTRTSSVSYSRTFPNQNLTISSTFNISQNTRDSTITMTLPDLNIALGRFYPFKRKKTRGTERWYEKIAMQYTGQLSNSITTQENQLMHSSIIKDWRNGMRHDIPISATFTLFKYINVVPSARYTERWYSHKIMRSWDQNTQTEVRDTIYGFNRVYDYSLSLSANTTLYGFYKPWKKLFGDKVEMIRHVFKPSVSYSMTPDFGAARYGYWQTYVYTDTEGEVHSVEYSPYSDALYGTPSKGRSGTISFDVSNNLEMKVKSDRDSTGVKKISLIDELYAGMSYNTAATTKPWSDLSMRLRLKLTKKYTFNLNARFATYAYTFNESGQVVEGNRTEWSYGRFGRFQGMSQNLSYTFNNDTWKKWFGKKEDKEEAERRQQQMDEAEEERLNRERDEDYNEEDENPKKKKVDAAMSDDGYMKFKMPWSFTVSYGVTMSEDRTKSINIKTMRYPYKFTQTMNFSGNVKLTDGWNVTYSSGYDFDAKAISMSTVNISRDLHCFSMSAGMVFGPFRSYNFTFSANSSMLRDALKYDKRSSISSNIEWY
jgi:hypothetical protein